MQITPTRLPEVLTITPQRFGDARGWFSETWNAPRLAALGVTTAFVQDNHSFSSQPGTLRGLHYQRAPHAQAKLVRCTRGAIWDVAVDVRVGSPRYGQWAGETLTAQNGMQLFVPAGFLHGFITLTPDTEVQYKCSDIYAPDCDGAVAWDDPAIGIAWPGLPPGGPVLSAKDAAAPRLADAPPPFTLAG
jgi:dTDP-4-dehydrorhamnose 3,5-epimerase